MTGPKEFVQINAGTAPSGVIWDSLRAHLRGLLIQQVARTKGKPREWKRVSRKEATQAERRYVEDPTPDRQKEWLDKQQVYKMAIIRKSENRRISQRQCQFGEGERVGRMLSLLIRSNTPPPLFGGLGHQVGRCPLMQQR